jgi:protein-tyrosine phosphatase
MIRVCFVCLGNICRSPTAEGVMLYVLESEGLAASFAIESAGTGDWHVGEPADDRARACARRRGVDLKGRARQFVARDFDRFDYVIAMDRKNLRDLRAMARSEEERGRIFLLREFEASEARDHDVPDPYYGGADGFERVFEICEAGCRGLLAHIRREHALCSRTISRARSTLRSAVHRSR